MAALDFEVHLDIDELIEMLKEQGWRPVKRGRWIAHETSIKGVPTESCSECGEWTYGYNENYCPRCGAKMGEEG